MIDQHLFLNMIRSLHNIDGCDLPELTHFQKSEFISQPVRYLMRAKDEHQAAIFREVMKRQAPQSMQHVAYFDEGSFHWMSGIAPRDCELYAARPDAAIKREEGA